MRTAERLANLMAVFCILSRRVLWLTMLKRTAPDASPKMALTDTEIALLDQLVSGAGNRRCRPGTLPFLDTYRTMCLAPEPAFRQILEDVRGLRLVA